MTTLPDEAMILTEDEYTDEALKKQSQELEENDPLVIILGAGAEGRFRAVKNPPKWAFMKMAVASRSKDEIKQMAALVQLTLAVVVQEDRERLDEYLSENDEALDLLQEQLSKVSAYWTGRPLEESSNSSMSSPPEAMPQSHRHVSFSQDGGKVETVDLPMDGQSPN